MVVDSLNLGDAGTAHVRKHLKFESLLRFSCCSSKGVGVRVLAEMACCASIQTTQRYIDVNDEQMRCAAELI